MQILLTRSGGFAALPGLTGRVVIDTDTLAPPVREEVERLVGGVDLASATAQPPAPGAADHIAYELTVLDDGTEATATFTSPVSDPDVAGLISRLEQLARGDTLG
jgi:emfourin